MARNAVDPDQPVPGVVVEHRLRDAGTGNNWHGRDRSGAPVVVRMLRLPVDGKARDRALLEARELIALAHPHLVSVRDAAPTVDGIAVVRDSVPGAISLARLLARRAALTPGEIITIGVPMFQALAVLHEAGHTHGRVRPEDILIEPGGRPMLTGAGIAGVLGAAGLPASDVGELAGLLLSALGPPAPPGEDPLPKPAGAVAAALAPAVADDLSLRPEAAGIAGALGRCCPPVPLELRTDGGEGRAWRVPTPAAGLSRHNESGSVGSGWPVGPGAAGESGSVGSGWPAGPGAAGESGSVGSGWPAGPDVWGEPGPASSGRPARSGDERRPFSRSRRLGSGALLVVHAAARLRRLTGAQTLAAAVLVLGAVALIAWVVIPGGSAAAPGSESAAAQGASTPPPPAGSDASLRTGLPAQPTDDPGHDATAWRALLSGLDAARSQAYSRGARDQLADVDVANSPAHLEDLNAFDAMRARSAYVQALSPRIEGLAVVSADSTRAVLRVTDTVPPYQFVDAGGRVLQRVPGRGRAVNNVTVVRSPAGWRVLVVDAARGT